MSKFTVGQELYFVPSRKGAEPRIYTIAKVGRQYLTLNNRMRAPINTLFIENFGQLYLSEEHYQQQKAINDAWHKLLNRIDKLHRNAPKGITLEAIEQAEKLIFGEQKG